MSNGYENRQPVESSKAKSTRLSRSTAWPRTILPRRVATLLDHPSLPACMMHRAEILRASVGRSPSYLLLSFFRWTICVLSWAACYGPVQEATARQRQTHTQGETIALPERIRNANALRHAAHPPCVPPRYNASRQLCLTLEDGRHSGECYFLSARQSLCASNFVLCATCHQRLFARNFNSLHTER